MPHTKRQDALNANSRVGLWSTPLKGSHRLHQMAEGKLRLHIATSEVTSVSSLPITRIQVTVHKDCNSFMS